MKKKWLIAAVCVLMLVLTACGGGQGEETTDAPAETTAPAPQLWESNILRNDDPGENGIHYSVARDGFELRDEYPYYVFDSEYRREQIRTIRILDTLTDAPEDAWDVSEAGNGAVLAWVEPSGELYDLYIGAEGGVNAPRDCTYLFFGYVNMEQIDFGNAFHTADVVFMDDMFLGCKSLSNLDLSGFDTFRVFEMPSMFAHCANLTSLNLSGFDTSNVHSMWNMFEKCSSLTSLDLSSFNTSKVGSMSEMFLDCTSLTELDLSSFDTSAVGYMSEMFSGCRRLASLDLSSFDTSNVQEMPFMFKGCEALTDLILSNRFVTANANARNMFYDCPAGDEWGHLSD